MSSLILITGASTGIGRAAAEMLAQRGHEVLAGVRNAQAAEALRQFPRVTPVLLDVANEAQIAEAVAHAQRLAANRPVVLINNAGIAVGGPVECVPLARWREQFEVNVLGLVRMTQACLPLIRRSRGRIVNVGSIAGLLTSPSFGPYSASKHAVEAISDALRMELRSFGVAVSLIEPGPVDTPIWDKNIHTLGAQTAQWSPELREVYGTDVKRTEQNLRTMAEDSVPMGTVMRAIRSAVESARPRPRYLVASGRLRGLLRLTRLIPTRWTDGALLRRYGM